VTRARPPAGSEDLRRRILVFIRKAAPFAYCNACLALRCDASLADTVGVLAELTRDDDAVLARARRACHGCNRTLEISALRDGPRR
jgi:hypothetical protein